MLGGSGGRDNFRWAANLYRDRGSCDNNNGEAKVDVQWKMHLFFTLQFCHYLDLFRVLIGLKWAETKYREPVVDSKGTCKIFLAIVTQVLQKSRTLSFPLVVLQCMVMKCTKIYNAHS